ncbi:MAG: hypothetical protein H0X17_10835 [Deltaproteobacteria bacterium]|nr:hypothetical protein [Deltaproteobacteria bacterium]
MRMAVLCCALVGCTYKPGSFAYPAKRFPGERATVGCLDVSVERRANLESKAVLAYQFGNRCDRPVSIDLGRATVIGRTIDGTEVKLAPYDPALEIEALRLDARLVGGEALAYPSAQPLAQVCVDVSTIAGDAPSHWMCFGAGGAIARAGEQLRDGDGDGGTEPTMTKLTDHPEEAP